MDLVEVRFCGRTAVMHAYCIVNSRLETIRCVMQQGAGDGLRTITQCRGYFQCHPAVETGLLRLDFKYDNKAGMAQHRPGYAQ